MIKKLALFAAAVLMAGQAFAADQAIVGLITKTESNPFFVKMKEGRPPRRRSSARSSSPAPAPRTATTRAR